MALGRTLEAFGGLELPPLTLDRFALCRSDLHPDGARHEMLAEYKLAL
ncbi:hypothetical protein [Aliiroseovarius crassostreae]|nr:hypothetical protein [Aliiroseovarius crassostreae]